MSWLRKVFGDTGAKIITIAAAIGVTVATGGTAAGLFGLSTAAGGVFAASLGLTGIAAAAVGLAGTVLAGALLTSALVSRGPSDPFAGTNSSLADVLGTRVLSGAQTSNACPWAIGNSYLSGQIFDTVLSSDQQTLWYAILISEIGSNQTFTFDTSKMYWGDKLVTFDGTDATRIASLTDAAGTVDTKIAGNVFVYFYPAGGGTNVGQNTTQTSIQVMSDSAIPAANRWPATNTVSNAAFVIIKIKYNQTAGITGLVTPKFRITSNVAYSKPGTIWYEYMTNKRFGLGMDPSIVDQASANAWDAYADELITYNPAGGGAAVTQPRYRLNGVIDTKQTFRANLDLMFANADAFFRFDEINNKWQVIPNMPSTSVFSFNDNNIIGAFSFSPRGLRDTYTGATISFPDATILDQQNNVYLSVPNSLLKPTLPPNILNVTYALTNDNVQAQYLANRLLEQAQEDLVISFNASYNALGLQAGDVVDVTNTTYGWVGKLFRVAEVKEDQSNDLGLFVNVLCVEYNADVYDNFNITAFTPAPNTNLPDPSFFGTLTAPTTSNSLPTAAVPSFDVTVTVPSSGIANEMSIFYGNSNDPLLANLLVTLPNASSAPYAPGSTLTTVVATLPAGTYYFFSRAKNAIAQSAFSPPSVAFAWNPQPTSTSSGVTVNAEWQPSVVLVPANTNNVATTVGQTASLSVYLGLSLLDYSSSTTDAGMANNTWRVDTATISTGLTLTGPVASTTAATWTVTAMTVNAATLTVSMRYKNATGTVTSIGSTLIGFTEVVRSADGSTAYLNQSPLVIAQNADGSFPAVPQNLVFTINTAGTLTTRTQPVSVNTSGFITYGTPSGDTGITITTTGSGARFGTVNFTQTATSISLTGIVQVLLLAPINTTYVIYRRSATTAPETAPATPTGGTINTATGFLSTPPTGWSSTIPGGTNVLYQSQVSVTYQPSTGTFNITQTWSNPTQSSQTLTNGARYVWGLTSSLYIPIVINALVYFRQLSTVAPTTPTGGTVSITAGTATLTPPVGWTATVDNNNYDPKFSSSSVVTTVSDTINYTPTWTIPFFIYNPVGQIAVTPINRTGVQPGTVPNPTTGELLTLYGRNQPKYGDAVVVAYAGPPTSTVSFTYNGTSWVQAASFIKGDQVVSGTITATQIAAQTITGDRIAAATIAADRLNVNQLSAITANMGTLTAGSIQVGSNPVRVGTSMTGFGATINAGANGDFAMGNSQTNITFPGGGAGAITINGRLIVAGNIVANTITANECLIDGVSIVGGAQNRLQVGTINTGQVINRNANVVYAASNLTNVINLNGASFTTLLQWSSLPFVGVGLSTTFTVLLSNVTVANASGGASTMTLTAFGSLFTTASIPAGTSIQTISFANTFIGNPGTGVISARMLNNTSIDFNAATLTITFQAIPNPQVTSKELIGLPGFNTFP